MCSSLGFIRITLTFLLRIRVVLWVVHVLFVTDLPVVGEFILYNFEEAKELASFASGLAWSTTCIAKMGAWNWPTKRGAYFLIFFVNALKRPQTKTNTGEIPGFDRCLHSPALVGVMDALDFSNGTRFRIQTFELQNRSNHFELHNCKTLMRYGLHETNYLHCY